MASVGVSFRMIVVIMAVVILLFGVIFIFVVRNVVRKIADTVIGKSTIASFRKNMKVTTPECLMDNSPLPRNFSRDMAYFMIYHINAFYSLLLPSHLSPNEYPDLVNDAPLWEFFYAESSSSPQAALISYDSLDLSVLVFRGTKGRQERSLDMKFNLEKPPFDKETSQVAFHRGFLSQYMDLRMQLLYCLSIKNTGRLLVSGHSLGGALANILVYDIISCGLYIPFNVYVVNFGTPRVGNEMFAKWVGKEKIQLHSMQNTLDPFCNIPFPRMPRFNNPFSENKSDHGTYRHAGSIHAFTSLRGKSLMDFHSISIYTDHLKWDSLYSYREMSPILS